jgi:hypothetical protein
LDVKLTERVFWGVGFLALTLAGTANALTLGQVGPPDLGGCGSCEVFQRRVGSGGPSYTVPAGNWTITSWSARGGGTAAGKARLRVYRPTGTPGQFKLAKQTHLELIPANGHPSFATSLNVRGGDRLGIVTVDNLASAYTTDVTGDDVSGVPCDPSVGQLVGKGTTCKLSLLTTHLVNVSAELFPH